MSGAYFICGGACTLPADQSLSLSLAPGLLHASHSAQSLFACFIIILSPFISCHFSRCIFASQSVITYLTYDSETDPSVKSVQLIGSWDNFSSCNTMHRDVRRGRGQWRACHSLSNSNPNNTTSTMSTTPKATNGATANGRRTLIKTAASGGLNMGHTYYYYVRVCPWSFHSPFHAFHSFTGRGSLSLHLVKHPDL